MTASDTANEAGTPRPCGDCAMCCGGWLRTKVLGHYLDVGRPCPYTSGNHCTIHAERPEDPCGIFFCGWAEPGSRLPEWMQPNLCGVIVLTGRSSWRGLPVDILVACGRDPEDRTLEWYRTYSIESRRPFIYQHAGAWFGFGPREFREEIAAKAARGEALWT